MTRRVLDDDKTGAGKTQVLILLLDQHYQNRNKKIAMFPTNTAVWNFYQPVLVSCVHRGCEYKAIPISASSHRDYAANCARFLAPERQMGRTATGGIARSISLRQLIPRTWSGILPDLQVYRWRHCHNPLPLEHFERLEQNLHEESLKKTGFHI